jgi:hypothetical protein
LKWILNLQGLEIFVRLLEIRYETDWATIEQCFQPARLRTLVRRSRTIRCSEVSRVGWHQRRRLSELVWTKRSKASNYHLILREIAEIPFCYWERVLRMVFQRFVATMALVIMQSWRCFCRKEKATPKTSSCGRVELRCPGTDTNCFRRWVCLPDLLWRSRLATLL